MSKTSATKSAILEMLAEDNKRLTDIYPKLNLTPATVAQHLKELEEMGLVKKTADLHFRNIKYYALDKKYVQSKNIQRANKSKLIPWFFLIFVFILSFALMLFINYQNQHSHKQGVLELLVLDPPNVPYGTDNLTMAYGTVYAHINGTTNGWVEVDSGGTINLISATNTSVFMGRMQLQPNAFIDGIAFNISGATITIKNVSYKVVVPNKEININVKNVGVQNNQTVGILLGISPTVLTVYNSSVTNFVMKYYIRATPI